MILWQTIGNDVWNNLFPTHWPKDGFLKPTFRLQDGQLEIGIMPESSEEVPALVRHFIELYSRRLRRW